MPGKLGHQQASAQSLWPLPGYQASVPRRPHGAHAGLLCSASQAKAIGINQNTEFPKIVGFYTDANSGFTHGFLDSIGGQVTIDDPEGNSSKVTSPVQNLLGVNDANQAAGFWTDKNTVSHGFFGKLGRGYTTFDVEINGVKAARAARAGGRAAIGQ